MDILENDMVVIVDVICVCFGCGRAVLAMNGYCPPRRVEKSRILGARSI